MEITSIHYQTQGCLQGVVKKVKTALESAIKSLPVFITVVLSWGYLDFSDLGGRLPEPTLYIPIVLNPTLRKSKHRYKFYISVI